MGSPTPVPPPTCFVVKNGWKIRCSSAGGTPGPVSWHARRTEPDTIRVLIVITYFERAARAAQAFVSRFMKSCSSFFFQAEDGIRDKLVTGVQTCALPI